LKKDQKYILEYLNISNFAAGEVEERQKERTQKEAKDSRNLYLAREGIIREGTKVSIC
jgi:hypothetical protein